MKKLLNFKYFFLKLKVLIILLIFFFLFFNFEHKKIIFFDKYETNIYNEIKKTLEYSHCSLMTSQQRYFINGIIRKFKPKKIVELGVYKGGSSIIILNAIKDIKYSHLYSIEINKGKHIGKCVKDLYPKFLDNWSLYSGNIALKYLEEIGGGIDLAFIDTAHFEPGEILDFLMILPYLKKKALVIFHDIVQKINTLNDRVNNRNEWLLILYLILLEEKNIYPQEAIF